MRVVKEKSAGDRKTADERNCGREKNCGCKSASELSHSQFFSLAFFTRIFSHSHFSLAFFFPTRNFSSRIRLAKMARQMNRLRVYSNPHLDPFPEDDICPAGRLLSQFRVYRSTRGSPFLTAHTNGNLTKSCE